MLAPFAAAAEPMHGLFRWSGDEAQAGESARRFAAAAPRPARAPVDPERAAMDFLRARAQPLGFTSPEEALRLRRKDTDRFGATHLRYDRYVEGLRLENMEVIVHVGADGSVTGVNGYAVQVPPALASQAALWRAGHVPSSSEAKIRDQVALDMRQDAGTLQFLSLERVAAVEAPWLVWVVEAREPSDLGRWRYRLKDESGEILARDHIVIE